MICPFCSATEKDGARFCSTCGKSLQKQAPAPSTSDQALYSKWAENFFTGSMKSNTGEIWNYEKGQVRCVEGNPKGLVFAWNGATFKSDNEQHGYGTWDGTKIRWNFPVQLNNLSSGSTDSSAFYTYTCDFTSGVCKNDSGIYRTDPLRYTSFVHWKVDKQSIKVAEGSDVKEGAATAWEVQGDVPPPVALIVAMYTRAQALLADAIQRSRRRYKRCGKLVLTSAGTPILCNNCAALGNLCITCDEPLTGQKFQGKICKTCAPRKNFCIKCGDPVGPQSKAEGFLCPSCGIGKASDNCCKMNFSIN